MNQVPWTVVIPVKGTGRGKSRIAVPAELRRRLALAMALDTVEAAAGARSVGRVLAVVEDPGDARAMCAVHGVLAHRTQRTGLNPAILDGLQVVADRWPGPVAVLPGDLPGLTPDDLDEALELCAAHAFAVVPDRQGVGTTLLAARHPALLVPSYGPDSFARHRAAGAAPIELPDQSPIRRDVDVVGDLAGLRGSRTAAVSGQVSAVTPVCEAEVG